MNPNRLKQVMRSSLRVFALLALFSDHVFATCSSTVSGTTATVNCSQTTDTLTLSQTSGYWYHEGSLSGASVFDWDSATAGSQNIASGGWLVVTFSAGGGRLNIGNSVTPADALIGAVSIANPVVAGTQVFLDSSASTSASTYTVDDNVPAHTQVNQLSFSDASSAGLELAVSTGSAADTVNILSVFGNDSVITQGNDGDDHVNIGDAGSVQSINGPITILNDPGFAAITIDDHADNVPRVVAVTATGVVGIAPAPINWNYYDIGPVILGTGVGNTVNVLAVNNPLGKTSLTIKGTYGYDIVNIGDAGSVQAIKAPVLITNSPARSTVTIDDSADAAARTVYVTASGATGIAPAPIQWDSAGLGPLTLSLGTGNDVVYLQSIANPAGATSLSIQSGGSGSGIVVIGDAGNAQAIESPVSIAGHAMVVFIDDSADALARRATLSATGISGLTPGPIAWAGADINILTVNFGSGDDVLHVLGTPGTPSHSSFDNVYLGDGSNECHVNGSGLGALTYNTFTGGAGDDLFVISATPKIVNGVTITGDTQLLGDAIVYTSGAASGAFPGNGTLVPADTHAREIEYNSIELFSIGDVIFFDGFE